MTIGKVTLNKRLITDSFIAGIAVNTIPGLANKYIFTSTPLTGMTLTLAGAAGAYLLAMLMKKPDIANIGIGIAGSQLVQGFINGFISGVTSTPVSDFNQLPYRGMRDYTNDLQAMPSSRYKRNIPAVFQ